jgi:tetratricopeptide (TPR) repeat protein
MIVLVIKRTFCVLILAVMFSACSTLAPIDKITADEKRWLLSGEALPIKGEQEIVLPDEDILELTDEMRKFAELAVSGYSGKAKLKALLGSILSPSGLYLQYDAGASFTAQETFRFGKANCLSFTNMFITMARHVDLEVMYNEVDVPPIWDMRQTNTLVLNKHVNAVVIRLGKIRQVVDLAMEEFEPTYEQRYISDELAIAQHYNNKAMKYLASGQHVDAFRYLAKALSIEPTVSYFWSNLGSIYRRAGNLDAAEMAYRVALTENPGNFVAISNASRLYEEIGQYELAGQYEKRAHYFRMRNPYYRYGLAQKAFLKKDYELARKHTKAAIHHHDKEHRFYFLLGAIYQRTGDSKLATDNFSKALELSFDDEQQAKYRRKIDILFSMDS